MRETDKRARAANVAVARERCAAWRCPRDGHTPDVEQLGPDERDAIDDVARLTGYAAATCPMACLYGPDVKRVALAKRYKLSPSVERDPPAVLFVALAAMEHGEGEMLEWLREHPKKPPERQAPQGPVTDVRDFPLPKLQRR